MPVYRPEAVAAPAPRPVAWYRRRWVRRVAALAAGAGLAFSCRYLPEAMRHYCSAVAELVGGVGL